jgi:aminoglycoside phosphotransferase family enzyme/predicted kinase
MTESRWVDMRETHIGVVFLVGEHAYKMKKPVTTGFLDFSTPQRRLAACRREVELNRRLAPDVYLGVSGVSGAEVPPWAGQGADGAPVEHLVVMRRMPDDRRLSTLVRAGAPVRDHLRDLARSVAAFHAAARRDPDVTTEGSRDALGARWAANIEQVRAQCGVPAPETVDAVDRLAARFLAGRGPLFADRCADGRIVDGHGDLIADDVFCLDDGPRALDCLEFDDKLRYVDGLDDVAFLAMDLERLGRPDLADDWLDDYVEFSGDPAPAALRHHYVAYRAFVRAKVACLRHQQGHAAAATDTAQYADLSLRHLEAGAVRLALVGGLPGTGKTTLSGALADRFGTVLLSSDRLRKELAGLAPDQPAPAAYAEGLYTAERTDALYAQLLHRAGALLARGESVVLDASWTHAQHRVAAEELAARTHSDLVCLECRAPGDLAAARLMSRGPTASDATAAVGRAMSAAADPWPDAVTVCTSGELAASLRRAAQAWQAVPARTEVHPWQSRSI